MELYLLFYVAITVLSMFEVVCGRFPAYSTGTPPQFTTIPHDPIRVFAAHK